MQNKVLRGKKRCGGDNVLSLFLTMQHLTIVEFWYKMNVYITNQNPELLPTPSIASLYQIASGKQNKIGHDTIVKIAIILGVTPNDLIKNPNAENGKW